MPQRPDIQRSMAKASHLDYRISCRFRGPLGNRDGPRPSALPVVTVDSQAKQSSSQNLCGIGEAF
jgi:hypothetical protein